MRSAPLAPASFLTPEHASAGTDRVLVVDDDEDLLALSLLVLREAGLNASGASSGAECLAAVAAGPPHVILLDINLPDLSGLEVCRLIKQNPETAGIFVMFLSGEFTSSEEQAAGLDAGAEGYIVRPVSQNELVARTSAMLRIRRAEARLVTVTEALRVKSRALSQIMDYSLDAICSFDSEGRFLELSAAVEKMLGYAREELIGRSHLEFVFCADRERTAAEMASVMAGQETSEFENRYVRKDGGLVVFMWSAYWCDSHQTMFCVARDVTERRVAERALHRMGQRFHTTLERMTDAFYMLDRDWCFTYLNRGAESLLMRPREEILGSKIWEEHPPSTHSLLREHYERCFFNNQAAHFEIDYEPLGRAFEVHAYPSEEGLAVYFRDVTERRRSGELLRESHERFRQFADNVQDAFLLMDAASRQILYVNPALRRLGGYSDDATVTDARMCLELVHPSDRERIRQAFRRDPGGVNEEFRLVRPDGTLTWVWMHLFPVRDGSGSVYRIAGIVRDVTQRKESEALIREQAELLDKAQEAILVLDLNDEVVFWNRSAEEIYEMPRATILGQRFAPYSEAAAIQHGDARSRVLQREEWMGELNQVTASGREIVVEAHWTLVRDSDGQPKSILCINTDITERKRLDTQLLRAQRMESIGTLAGGMAHDLNNVFAPILMSIELLKLHHGDDETKSVLDCIESSATRGADMVKQVLSFARGVEGKRVPVEPRVLLGEIQKMVSDTFPKNISFQTVFKPGLWNMVGDPTQLLQVLLNLCVNARDAMPTGGKLIVTVENLAVDENFSAMNGDARPGPHVLISVRDSGSGMSSEVINKMFDPFFTTKELGKGTGLGLSTSLAIVSSHGGFFQVRSEIGKGSEFRVHIPAAAVKGKSVSPQTSTLPRGNGELIMVIDDEKSIRRVTQNTLEAFGYRVILASDGAEAVALYAQRQSEVAAVLTDIMMPIMDGLAAIQVLSRMNPAVKIIATTGMNFTGQDPKSLSPNVKGFLAKPYSAEAILSSLAQVIAGPA